MKWEPSQGKGPLDPPLESKPPIAPHGNFPTCNKVSQSASPKDWTKETQSGQEPHTPSNYSK